MKSFKSIREAYSDEPGVTEIDDVQDDPMSFVKIKPKKSKVVKEDLQEAVSVKKEKHTWGTMMTVHHGSDTSYPLHPEHQSAIKKLRPGMKTTFKDETNSTVHAHREGDTVHLTRPKTGSTLTSLPYHHFDTSDHAKPAAKKPAGEYDRKVTGHLKKKYNEEAEQMNELNKDTVISYAARAEKDVNKKHKQLTSQIKSNNPLSANKTADKIIKRYSGMDRAENRLNKEETEQMDEKITSKDIKMAVGVAKDKRYAGGNMSGAVKTMEKMKPGLSKHPRVQQVLKSTNEASIQEKITVVHGTAPAGHDNKPTTSAGVTSGTVYTGHPAPVKKPNRGNYQFNPTSSGPKPGAQSALDQARLRMKKPMAEGSRPMTGSAHDRLVGAISSRISDTPQPRRAPKDDAEAASWARMERDKQAMQASRKKKVNEGIDFLKIWDGIKSVHEEVKTTHEDPLVVTKDEDGHIHTHANLSVANAIHGTNVKHQAIHTYKKVQDGKFTFELSKHHEGALKEDAPFDPVAHKKELDQLMGKHMAAHTQTTKLINAKAPQEQINKAQERNNAVKQEIRNHKDKVPKGPAPKPGSAADYYASKKPGEYTGD